MRFSTLQPRIAYPLEVHRVVRWPWRQDKPNGDAKKAVRDADDRLREAREKWAEVNREVDQLRRKGQGDAFAALFHELGGGRR